MCVCIMKALIRVYICGIYNTGLMRQVEYSVLSTHKYTIQSRYSHR